MAFDRVFQGPPSDTAAPGTAQSPSLGVDVVNKELYVSSGQGWEELSPGGGGGTPGGTDGQLQWNNAGSFAGAGKTDGTYYALGPGATFHSVPTNAPNNGFLIPDSATSIIEETSTDPNYQNGLYVGLTLNPSDNTGTNSGAIGGYFNVTLKGTNFVAASGDVSDGIFGSWSSVVSQLNGDVTEAPGQLFGSVSGVYHTGTGELFSTFGMAIDSFNQSSGTIDTLDGAVINAGNSGTGNVGIFNGLDVFFIGGGNGGATTTANMIHVNVPGNSNDPVGTLVGLQIDEQAATGITNAYQIKSDGVSPSVFAGPISLPYTQAQTVYSATGTALPSAATAGVGARAFVSDSTAAAVGSFGAPYVGSGTHKVPVYSDGTSWLIG
jgi:hypothetical protein